MKAEKPIFVTQPSLPPLDEFIPYLEQIWESKWLTNGGPMHEELESKLCEHLGVEHISLCNNGTNALIIALQALGLTGEVITSPYSFVATAHSILWNNLEPVFIDVEPANFNLDPDEIEAAVTPRTSAIMPVHCYGTPCDVAGIQRIADRHGLKIIYDAAHAFGVRYRGESLVRHGDLAVLSFHATKVFNTFEGGAIVCHDKSLKQRIDRLRNFGIVDEVTVTATGMNGKMNEVQAAFGLLQLRYVDAAIARRYEIDAAYRQALAGVAGITCAMIPADTARNCGYFPILVGPEFGMDRDGLYRRLREHQVHSRRYFFPLLSDLPMYRGLPSAQRHKLPRAASAADHVLCLPIYSDLTVESQQIVIEAVSERRT